MITILSKWLLRVVNVKWVIPVLHVCKEICEDRISRNFRFLDSIDLVKFDWWYMIFHTLSKSKTILNEPCLFASILWINVLKINITNLKSICSNTLQLPETWLYSPISGINQPLHFQSSWRNPTIFWQGTLLGSQKLPKMQPIPTDQSDHTRPPSNCKEQHLHL